MARTFKASGARLELDTVRGEIRIIRDKNRVTKRHQLTDCTIPFSDITAIELEVPTSGQPGRMVTLVRGQRLLSPAGADRTYLEFYDYPAFYVATMTIKNRVPSLVLSNRGGSVPSAASAPPGAAAPKKPDWAGIREPLARLAELGGTPTALELSGAAARIQELAGAILRTAEEKPEQKTQVRTFFNYYLPTSVKLFETYADLTGSGIQTASVTRTKREIEEAAEVLVKAFEKELDGLFAADALDVATDIQVLEVKLSRDGLLDSPFTVGDGEKG